MSINFAKKDLSGLGSVLSMQTSEDSTVGIQIRGAGTGFSIVPEGSMDGGETWVALDVYPTGAGAATSAASALTATGNWEVSTAGFNVLRARNQTAATGGAVNVVLNVTKSERSRGASAAAGGVSGDVLTNSQLRAAPLDTTALTNSQLRSTALGVDIGAIAGERPLLDALAITTNNTGYKFVPAGSTNFVLSGVGVGAVGDTINRIIFIVTNDATCTVTLTDGTGTNGVLNNLMILQPNTLGGTFSIDMGDLPSMDGPWKVTTGAGVSLIVIGKLS